MGFVLSISMIIFFFKSARYSLKLYLYVYAYSLTPDILLQSWKTWKMCTLGLDLQYLIQKES